MIKGFSSIILSSIIMFVSVMILDLSDPLNILVLVGVSAGVFVLISWRMGIFKKMHKLDQRKLDDLNDEDVEMVKQIVMKHVQSSITEGKEFPLQVTFSEEFGKDITRVLRMAGFENTPEIVNSLLQEATTWINQHVTLKHGGTEDE